MYYSHKDKVEFKELVGKTFTRVHRGLDNGDDVVYFGGAESFRMLHQQDCCEYVGIEDIEGNLEDLENSPILRAEKTPNSDDGPKSDMGYEDDCFTWTYYNIRTVKGSVNIRWYGSSNGYYSEDVDVYRV